VKPKGRLPEIVELLRWTEAGSAIVYAGTRKRTDELAADLVANGFVATGYHAGLPGAERALRQDRFLTGQVRVMVATNAFGMGIDKPDIRAVVHWRLPETLEAYYQEVGRAGRDGSRSICLGFLGKGDLSQLRFLIRGNNPWPSHVEREHHRLAGLAGTDGRLVIDHEGLSRSQRMERDILRNYLIRFGALERSREGTLQVDRDWVGLTTDERHWMDRKRDGDLERLEQVAAYADGTRCRMLTLEDYFGFDDLTDGCGHCDVCRPVARSTAAPVLSARGTIHGGSSAKAPPPSIEDPAELLLLERLRMWRREQAAGRPAYTVLHDRTLAELVVRRPRNHAELADVHGIGPSRLERYGDALLALLVDTDGV
jgi:ATP-dependent DNA helicase RecQ